MKRVRNEKLDKLRGCPTCGTPVEQGKLGLRDYSWISGKLPGKVGLMDIDGVLERKGKVLMLETKPLRQKGIPLGQRLTLRTFTRMGVHVWLVWHDGDEVQVGRMDEAGEVPFTTKTDVAGLVKYIEQWYEQADNGEL